METMSTPETVFQAKVAVRPMTRAEYHKLGEAGFFEEEKVELLFGMVVPMTPISPAHETSKSELADRLRRVIRERAHVRVGSPLAASEISEPEPDVMVLPDWDKWHEHPIRAHLVVEVSWTSLRTDKKLKTALYGLAEVDEYWIINLVEEVVEVYRDRHDGEWRSRMTHARGEKISMIAFPDVEIEVSSILPPA